MAAITTEPEETQVPLADVAAAVRKCMQAEGTVESYRAPRLAAVELGVSFGNRRASWTRFCGQVSRELNKQVRAGELRKTGKGGITPDRVRLAANETRYYTPEAYEAASLAGDEHQEVRRVAMERRKAICRRLSALVLPPVVLPSGRITMDLEHWEILLDLAEKGAKP